MCPQASRLDSHSSYPHLRRLATHLPRAEPSSHNAESSPGTPLPPAPLSGAREGAARRRLLLFLHLFRCPSPPRPHIFNSYQRQEFGTRRPQQTPFPRTSPGAGKEEEKREPSVCQSRGRRARLPASKCSGPQCPRKRAEVPLLCTEGVGEKRRDCARQDGGSRRTASIKGRRQTTRYGARDLLKTQSRCCETHLLQRESHWGSRAERHPTTSRTPPPHGRATAPWPALTRAHPAAQRPYAHACAVLCSALRYATLRYATAVGRHSLAPAHPTQSLTAAQQQLAVLRGAGWGFKHPPPRIIYPARIISVSLGRVHLCR